MGKTLSIAELIPERNNVDFGGGRVLDILSREEMDTTDYARLMQMKARAEKLQNSLPDEGDVEKVAEGMDDLNTLLGELLQILMPELDDDTLAEQRLGIRVKILEWWQEQAQLVDPKAQGQELPS